MQTGTYFESFTKATPMASESNKLNHKHVHLHKDHFWIQTVALCLHVQGLERMDRMNRPEEDSIALCPTPCLICKLYFDWTTCACSCAVRGCACYINFLDVFSTMVRPCGFPDFKDQVDRLDRNGFMKPADIVRRLLPSLENPGDEDMRRRFAKFVKNRVARAAEKRKLAKQHKVDMSTQTEAAAKLTWRFEEGQEVTVSKGRYGKVKGVVKKRKLAYVVHYTGYNNRTDDLIADDSKGLVRSVNKRNAD
ncbi:uncharacterized protein LOC144916092 [Branchiostoma floridae x Branchiostoma belcheri]